jgi:probable HAF family extracellular repeat protein
LVVGDSNTAGGPAHAFVFDHSQLKDLGTLPGYETASYARGINSSGDIVGESDRADQKRAFLATKGQLVELDKLADNLTEAGFNSLDVAYGINDKGSIVGYGTTTDNLTAAFIAVPEGHGNQELAGGVTQYRGQEQPVSASNEENYNVFYTQLSPEEGSWVEAGQYGYCFRPRVSGDWRPYRDGHWVGPIAAGIGSQTSVLPGQPITTVDGSILRGLDGAGSPEINGRRRGFPGEKVMKTSAGLHFHPKQTSP